MTKRRKREETALLLLLKKKTANLFSTASTHVRNEACVTAQSQVASSTVGPRTRPKGGEETGPLSSAFRWAYK